MKKRVVAGTNFSSGDYFLWALGWGAASYFSGGLALIIYFLVKRKEINETKARFAGLMQGISATQYYEYHAQQQAQQPYQATQPMPYQQVPQYTYQNQPPMPQQYDQQQSQQPGPYDQGTYNQ